MLSKKNIADIIVIVTLLLYKIAKVVADSINDLHIADTLHMDSDYDFNDEYP